MDEFLLTTRDYTQNGPYDFVMLERRQHDLGFVDIRYDSQDRRVVTQTSAGKQLVQQLDQFERPILSQLADDLPVSFNYDSRGRLASSDQGDRHTEFTYDSNGFLRSVRDPLGRVSEVRFDASGRMTQSQNPLQEVTGFSYDANGCVGEPIVVRTATVSFLKTKCFLIPEPRAQAARAMSASLIGAAAGYLATQACENKKKPPVPAPPPNTCNPKYQSCPPDPNPPPPPICE